MTQTHGQRAWGRRLPSPRWGAVLGALVGVAAFAAILTTSDHAKPFGNALGPAVTAFLGAVVAGWGITQVEIAQETKEAAERQAAATDDQVAEARNQLAHARHEAQRLTMEAAESSRLTMEALALARKQWLDALAPRAALICHALAFTPVNEGELTHERVYTDIEANTAMYRLSAVIEMCSYDNLPLVWTQSRPADDSEPNQGSRGIIMPGDKWNFLFDETKSLNIWALELQRWEHEKDDPGRERGFKHISVSTQGQFSSTCDNHYLAFWTPPILRDGSHIIVKPWKMQYDVIGGVTREYFLDEAQA